MTPLSLFFFFKGYYDFLILVLCSVISSGKKAMWQSSRDVFLISSSCFVVLPIWKNEQPCKIIVCCRFENTIKKKGGSIPTTVEGGDGIED